MKTRYSNMLLGLLPAAMLWSASGHAQVPVDDDGNVIGSYEEQANDTYTTERPTGNEGIPLLDHDELQELVGPVALYPDDLLAVVLPASTYPLQVVQAARFLEDLKSNPELKPDPDWDDSIIALINYPEVVELLNEDLDWTWRLGEAVVAQQADVVSAVEDFRNRAYAAGNLKSDDYQTVTADEGVIEIVPVNEDVIYVPYYEPAQVVYYQPRPVYYYYPRPCPVYYYPYPSSYSFNRGYFWGVTTAFAIGWRSDHLSVFHHSYRGHPYYGVRYWDRWWYRRPSIHVYNRIYVNNNVNVSTTRYRSGDRWRPSRSTRLRYSDQRISRNTYQPQRHRTDAGFTDNRRQIRSTRNSTRQSTDTLRRQAIQRNDNRADRNGTTNAQRRQTVQERNTRRQADSQNRRSSTARQSEDARRRQAIARNDYRTDRNGVTNVQRRQTVQERSVQRQAHNDRRRSTTTREVVQRQTTARNSVQRQTSERRQSWSSDTARRQQVQRQRAPAPQVREHRSAPVPQPAERRQSYARAERRAQPAAQNRQPATANRSNKQTTQRRSQSSDARERRSSSTRRSAAVHENRRRH